MKKILLTDDHDVLLFGTSILLKELIPKAEIQFAYTFNQALSALSTDKFDLMLLDIDIPGGNSISMIKKIKTLQPTVKILMFSSYDETIYAISYLQAGADGYLNKLSTKEQLQNAVNTIISGKQYVSDSVKELLLNSLIKKQGNYPNEFVKLSQREIEVMNLLALGKGTTEIAHELNLGFSTISTYRNRIFEKLRVSNIVDMVKKIENIQLLSF